MSVNDLSIKRQHDNTYSLVAVLESKDGYKKEIKLHNGASTANELQEEYLIYTNDEESLQVDIMNSLIEVI
ncbi:hypothetical protein ACWA2C_16170 [Priestia megaterium]